ncbi:hypothetical protein [Saccharothrix obliqua]|nr:hypothetical protein [Saccharothrix obliqua]
MSRLVPWSGDRRLHVVRSPGGFVDQGFGDLGQVAAELLFHLRTA